MKREFQALENHKFDMLVIGGGIYGAWTACNASLRNLQVAIIEKNDWASETSSASSKLFHGGLRYLQSFQISLVKKALKERNLLARLAPHQVQPVRFVVPVYEDTPFNRISLKCGLTLYDLLAGRLHDSGHRYLGSPELKEKYPFLRSTGVKGGFSYMDCKTDDARFTLEVINGAYKAGAVAVNHAEATSIIKENGQVCGAMVTDNISGKQSEIRAKVVVNASGSYAHHLDPDNGFETLTKNVYKVGGIHLIMPPLGSQDAFLFVAHRDKRVFFSIPWYGMSLVGTTETMLDTAAVSLNVKDKDKEYLLSEYNSNLDYGLKSSDIRGSFAGVRVLAGGGDTAYVSRLSRQWNISSPAKGLFLSVGGKFTTARGEADDIVRAAMEYLGKKDGTDYTAVKPLPWSPGDEYAGWKAEQIKSGQILGLDEITAEYMTGRFGTAIASVYSLISKHPELAKRVQPELPFCKAEVIYAIREEMAMNLEDVLRRRIPALILSRLDNKLIASVAQMLSSELGWQPEKTESEVERIVHEQGNTA